MTHNTSIPNLNSTILCIFLAEISMKFSSKDTSLRNITHHIISKSEFQDFVFIVSWSCVWRFIQKIPPWELWYKPLQFQIPNYQFGAYFGLKLSMKFYLKETSLRIMTHNTSTPNQIFSILCLFLADISMKFHSKSTSLRNMTHNASIPNQIFSILCLFLAEISMKFHSKRTSLRSMTHNT